jgi:NAD+ diphosphatase
MFRPDPHPPERSGDAVQFVFQRGQMIIDLRAEYPCPLRRDRLAGHDWEVERELFLGYWHDSPCYAVEIHARSELDPMRFSAGSLYQVLGRVEEQLFALAGRAAQLLAWERDHRFCGRCGGDMAADPTERAMRCGPCGTVNYPRINPCVIVLVTRGEELLLARNARFPRPFYSTLAGFIEAGENAEECLRREVQEEVGIEVGALSYFRSQSWPFPNQLMLGFFAEYRAGEIVCEPGEIADARWFHHSELPQVPPETSISGQLIRDYIERLHAPRRD